MLETTSCCVCGSGDSQPEADVLDWVHEVSATASSYVRCSSCGHVFQNPRPTIQDGPLMYPRENVLMAKADTNGLLRIKTWVQARRVNRLVSLVPEGGKILEVGAGDGLLLVAIRARRPDIDLIALDLTFEAATKTRLSQRQINVMEGAIDDEAKLSYLNMENFDLVIMNQSIEHLWNPRQVLERIYGALNAGGTMSISTPNFDGYDRRIWKQYWGGWYAPRHLNLFTKAEMVHILTDLGMSNVRVRNLVAPVIWCHSVGAFLKDSLKMDFISRFFLRSSPLLLLVFTAVDLVAKVLRLNTSNIEYTFRK